MNVQHFMRPGEDINTTPYHYKDCGLDNIILRNGFTRELDDGEEYLTIKDVDGLHKAIGMHIVLERKAPSGKELRFLRNELDMTQSELASMLSVSDQSVARWEKGQCEANGGAVFALRVIYLLSLVPEQERAELMNDLLARLRRLSESDETSDNVVMIYCGSRWTDHARAAA